MVINERTSRSCIEKLKPYRAQERQIVFFFLIAYNKYYYRNCPICCFTSTCTELAFLGAFISICIFRLQLAMHLERDVAFVIFPRWYLRAVVVVVSRRMRCGWYAPAERIYDRSSTRQAFPLSDCTRA